MYSVVLISLLLGIVNRCTESWRANNFRPNDIMLKFQKKSSFKLYSTALKPVLSGVNPQPNDNELNLKLGVLLLNLGGPESMKVRTNR
jgi:hypothetical protein